MRFEGDLELHQFLGWRDLSLPLENRGAVYVVGPNGSGKSSISAGLLWVLTGKCSRVGSIDDIVTDNTTGGCWGRVGWEHSGHHIRATRYRSHPKNRNNLVLEIDGKPLEPRHQASAQEILEQYCPSMKGYEDAVRTLYFSSKEVMMFSELREAEQKRIIRERFRFQKFLEAGEIVKADARAISGRYASESMRLENYKGRLTSYRSQYIRAKRAKEEAKTKTKVEAKNIARDIEQTTADISSIERHIEKLTARINEIRNYESVANSCSNQLDILNHQIKDLETTKSCPMCGQKLPQQDSKKQRKAYIERKRELLADLQEAESHIVDISPIEERLRARKMERRSKLDDRASLNAQLSLVTVRKQDVIEQFTKAKALYHKALQQVEDQEALVAKLEKKGQYYDWCAQAYSSRGMEAVALARVVPSLNAKINSYLQKLPTKRGIIKNVFSVEGTHLVHQFVYNGRTLPYVGLSGGEQRRVDISICMAFNSLHRTNCSLWIVDEGFENLDTLGVQKALELLQIGKETLLVTSHKPDLEGHFKTIVYCKPSGKYCAIEKVVNREQDVTLVGAV